MLKNRKIPLNLKRDFKTGEKRGDYEKCPACFDTSRPIYNDWFCADGELKDGR